MLNEYQASSKDEEGDSTAMKAEGMYKKLKTESSSKRTKLNFELHNTYDINSDCLEWWKSTVIYEVYIRSFCDSNGDGIGDLNGIKSKLDYFEYLGIETLWITPFYKSPMKDFGYDVSDFMDIDPIFGTLEDFNSLISEMKNRGLKMIMDFVPNHTSDQHVWFQRSVNKETPYTDYYVWKPMKGKDKDGNPIPPNNWVSVFGGAAWTFHPKRQEFYLHQFTKEQPDLNFRNSLVIEEMEKIMQFWLSLGVDGFRLDAAPHLLEDEEFKDEIPIKEPIDKTVEKDEYSFWDHSRTYDLQGVLDILASFRKVCDSFTIRDGFPRILVIEAYMDAQSLMKYYGTVETPIGHFPFNFDLMELEPEFNATDIYFLVVNWLDAMPKGFCPNWVEIGNHDRPRIATRLGVESIDLLNMVVLLLPGTAVTYYGEELGLENVDIPWENTVDPAGLNAGPLKYIKYSRDPCRTPMLWNNENNAGFSNGDHTWLPIHKEYGTLSVNYQKKSPESHLKTYRELVKLRNNGDIELRLRCLNENKVFAFTRITKDSNNGLLIVTNFGDSLQEIDVSCFAKVPDELSVVARSLHFRPDYLKIGYNVPSNCISMGPNTGIVFSFTPSPNIL